MNMVERVQKCLAAIEASGRPEVWIHLGEAAELERQAAGVEEAVAQGKDLPLAGLLVAVKDNIDVAGMPTTAGCPSYVYQPSADAVAVARLRAAGAVVVGKTNLDQFATGLVGSRSPYGAVRNAWDPSRISGGSSSGSAVAVALGLVDVALGTDTAGSGRVPAALNGIVGVKPTRGSVPTTGVVPACRSLDCVTVFARDRELAQVVRRVMADAPSAARARRGARFRIGVPEAGQLGDLPAGWSEAFAQAADAAWGAGCEVVEVDIAPLLEAARLLYEGAFVAERYAAVGEFISSHEDQIGDQVDPTVAKIVLAARDASAVDLFRDMERLEGYAAQSELLFADLDALLTPTTTRFPTLAEIQDDPVGINSAMGWFTNCANLLDLASLAIPAAPVDGLPFGIMLTAPAGSDEILDQVAAQISTPPVELLVVGAHMTGLPLNRELVSAGASLHSEVRTTDRYALYALDTTPAKPAMVRINHGGAPIAGEVWRIPGAMLASFMSGLPRPMCIGPVELDDGREVLGFLAQKIATEGAVDITKQGGWRAWLSQQQ